jgi:hypothetical protein
MAEDIISTVPWHCGNSDGCEQGWHLANYWVYDDGTYSCDNYADGDHEPCENDDVPTYEEEEQAWREYRQHVAETGDDCLHQFLVETTIVAPRRLWQAEIHSWIGASTKGPRIFRLRRRGRGKWLTIQQIPTDVLEYLNATVQEPWLRDFPGTDWREQVQAALGVEHTQERGGALLIWFRVDEKRPRSAARVTAELKRRARRCLARTEISQED